MWLIDLESGLLPRLWRRAAYSRQIACKLLAPQVGLEPTTLRLTAECSTIELLRSRVGNVTQHYSKAPLHCQILGGQTRVLGILVQGDNHFIVRGPFPQRATAFALVKHWSLIQIGGSTAPSLAGWRISTREFREDLEWAIVVVTGSNRLQRSLNCSRSYRAGYYDSLLRARRRRRRLALVPRTGIHWLPRRP